MTLGSEYHVVIVSRMHFMDWSSVDKKNWNSWFTNLYITIICTYTVDDQNWFLMCVCLT